MPASKTPRTHLPEIPGTTSAKTPEQHPLPPFLPEGAKLLMLGSFPPGRERWSMEFFYPNLNNDMWRIFGLAFFSDKDHFLVPGQKRFDRERLQAFLSQKGVALYDTAEEVIRHRGNASDQFLEVVTPVDLGSLLARIPDCTAIAATGQKATDTLLSLCPGAVEPRVGGWAPFPWPGREMRLYRMPSSSRAYPKPLAEKTAVYREMLTETGIL